MKILSFAAAVIAAAVLFVSCAADTGTSETETMSAETTLAAETEAEYVYEDDFGGAEINILNMDAYWGMYVTVVPEDIIGEALNDAVYERSTLVEQKLNCVIKDTRTPSSNNFDSVKTLGRNAVLAGEDIYDVMYLPINQMTSLVTDGYFYNLLDIAQLRLDEKWWDGPYNSASMIGDKLYFASGDLHLMAYDSSWCIFFNEDMLKNHNLDMPYGKVRSGEWTIDELHAYCKAIANLNSDADFAWDQNGTAVYGLSTHPHAPDKFIFSTGERYVMTDESHMPYFSGGTERFFGVVEKLAALLGSQGVTHNSDSDDFNAAKGGYVYLFANARAAFLTAEIKAAQLLRDMEQTFGILPFPKYDANQAGYSSALMSDLLVMTIPVTNNDASMTSVILDALSYESYRSVIPVYYNTTVSQKGLRNDDSIEMMQIMSSGRGADMAVVYSWNADLVNSLRTKLFKGDSAAASDIEKYKSKIEANIAELLEAFAS